MKEEAESAIQFEMQKTKSEDSETSSTAELGPVSSVHRESVSGTRERRESVSGTRERRESESRERKDSESGTRERRESGSGRERRESGSGREQRESGIHPEQGLRPGHIRRPSDSGIPQLVRDSGPVSGGQQPRSILSQKSSVSDSSDRVTSPIPPPSRNASARFDLQSSEPAEAKKSVTSTSTSTSTQASSTR